jgi:hypothetical protein
MLIALTSAARVQTIHRLTVNNMVEGKDEFLFQFNGLLKQSRPGFECSPVHMKEYPSDRRLCIFRVIKEYLARTEHIRKCDLLLISFIKLYGEISIHYEMFHSNDLLLLSLLGECFGVEHAFFLVALKKCLIK